MNTLILAIVLVAQMSWYDPSLCSTRPINCFDPAHWYRMAAGHDARDWYGQALACPAEFPLGTRFEITGSRWGLADGEWLCLDRGGLVDRRADGSIVLDLLRHRPVWGERLKVTAKLPQGYGLVP